MPPANADISNQVTGWLVTLDALQEANLALKHSISSEAKRAGASSERLEALEAFLTRSLDKDTHIALLRQDVKALERPATATDESAAYEKACQKLALDVARMSEQFAQLKADFEMLFLYKPTF